MSLRHSYNARSGVAVSFGKETKKLLFLAVRTKYSLLCPIAENRERHPEQLACYRNWTGLLGAMESNMIVEGFKQSVRVHFNSFFQNYSGIAGLVDNRGVD